MSSHPTLARGLNLVYAYIMNNIESAEVAKKEGRLFDWLFSFLQDTEKNNPDLLRYIENHKDRLQGPVLVSENLLRRTIGPEKNMLTHESKEVYEERVGLIIERLQSSPEEIPIILCERFEAIYYLLDGNHTFEALKKLGQSKFWVIYSEDSVIHKLLQQ